MAFSSLPHLAASLGVFGAAPGARIPHPSGSAHAPGFAGGTDDGRIARDGVVLSGAALHRTVTGVHTDGPNALAPVIAPETARELLDATQSAICRRPALAVQAQGNVSPSALAALLG
jgi:hypothetical protein